MTSLVDEYGSKVWRKNGQLHRDDGPAIERSDGTKEWHQYGLLHRTDGPAVTDASGNKLWYQNGRHHRTDGPAIEWANGDTVAWWYINDERLTLAEFAAKVLDKETALIWKMSGYCWPFDFGRNK